eukprot:TRINITY_DN70920_c0_g1_i1.p1 TRINITY_DN70920_c0_g1~~TRINITY_DN70920_c0_g1_i1.p1  ORF type:complete len:134 (+),score=3.78 TRINITY_DN70920_c0_g1_i1:127-528(+)
MHFHLSSAKVRPTILNLSVSDSSGGSSWLGSMTYTGESLLAGGPTTRHRGNPEAPLRIVLAANTLEWYRKYANGLGRTQTTRRMLIVPRVAVLRIASGHTGSNPYLRVGVIRVSRQHRVLPLESAEEASWDQS